MATVDEAFDNFNDFVEGFLPMLEKELESSSYELEDYVREQLYSGVNGKEKPLRPTYTDDPYWKTVTKSAKSAKARGESYRKYKRKITPPSPSYLGIPPRNDNTPNLIIRGDFYDSITAKIGKGVIRISTEGFAFGKEIENKYGSVIFGLGEHAIDYFVRNRITPAIKEYLSKYGL